MHRAILRGVLPALLGSMGGSWTACASGPEAAAAPETATPARYVQNRADYEAFRERHPELLEPNYLPFMAYRVRDPEPGILDRLRRALGLGGEAVPRGEQRVFCRWSEEDFPLAVYVEPPILSEDLDERLDLHSPEAYRLAVERALGLWEEGLEGLVRFRRAERSEDADLRLRLIGEPAPRPEPDVQVLGATNLGGSCEILDRDAEDGRIDVRYRVEELRIFVADRHGLLLPDQVERIALHEIGHALGMYGHSPIPADLMYEIVRDRLPRGELGTEDVNSFLSLYSIPNGTVYTRFDPTEAPAAPVPRAPQGEPRLDLAPHVDARLGYEIQLPVGWTRVDSGHGVVAVDGLTWDYDVSFQLIVRRYDTIESYLERHGAYHLGGGRIPRGYALRVGGHRAVRFVLDENEFGLREQYTFIETGDGRVLVVIAECPAEHFEGYEPWFEAILASLDLRDSFDESREYSPEPPGS